MNERLAKLTEQCYEYNETMQSAWFNKTKFAELIIEECASKVDNILREKKHGGGTMGDEIREHFGVEE